MNGFSLRSRFQTGKQFVPLFQIQTESRVSQDPPLTSDISDGEIRAAVPTPPPPCSVLGAGRDEREAPPRSSGISAQRLKLAS